MKPVNHHGGNPILRTVTSKQRKFLLKREARWRAEGEWGEWEEPSPAELQSIRQQYTGWVKDISGAFRNHVFSVLVRPDVTGIIHLGIASLSGIRPTWYEMQRIKDELFGQEKTAIEIYPPANEVVDGSDMFHLWVLPADLPFGLHHVFASRAADHTAFDMTNWLRRYGVPNREQESSGPAER